MWALGTDSAEIRSTAGARCSCTYAASLWKQTEPTSLMVNLETWKQKRIRKRQEEKTEARPRIGRRVSRKPACWEKTHSHSVHPPIPESPPKPREPTQLEPVWPHNSCAHIGLPLGIGSQTGPCTVLHASATVYAMATKKKCKSEIKHLSKSKGPQSQIPVTNNSSLSQAASASLT